MSGGYDSAPFVVTLGETMVALVAEEAGLLRYASRFQRRAVATTVPKDVEGLASWDELEQFALRPEGAVQR